MILTDNEVLKVVPKSTHTWKTRLVKGIIITTMIVLVAINTNLGIGLPSTDVECLNDVVFKATNGLNKYLQNHITFTKALIIMSSLSIDFTIISVAVYWTFFSKSWRVIFSMVIFYSFRALIQVLFQMRFPEGYIWQNPGFPSLTVSYLRTNDFFFSGHVGLPIIIACEYFKKDHRVLGFLAVFTCSISFMVMILTRGHYFIDLVCGLIIAHYVFLLVDKYIDIVDDSCISLSKIGDENGKVEYSIERHKLLL